MKVTSQSTTYSHKLSPSSPKEGKPSNVIATGIGISIRHKGEPENVIQKNDPKDPLVAKKILDSLNLGLINFDQRERDGIAAILSGRAQKVIENRASAQQ